MMIVRLLAIAIPKILKGNFPVNDLRTALLLVLKPSEFPTKRAIPAATASKAA